MRIILTLVGSLLAGCSSLEQSINELPADKKQGCYYKAVTANGNGIYTAANYGKDSVFCTENIKEIGYCYKLEGKGVSVTAGDCK